MIIISSGEKMYHVHHRETQQVTRERLGERESERVKNTYSPSL